MFLHDETRVKHWKEHCEKSPSYEGPPPESENSEINSGDNSSTDDEVEDDHNKTIIPEPVESSTPIVTPKMKSIITPTNLNTSFKTPSLPIKHHAKQRYKSKTEYPDETPKRMTLLDSFKTPLKNTVKKKKQSISDKISSSESETDLEDNTETVKCKSCRKHVSCFETFEFTLSNSS